MHPLREQLVRDGYLIVRDMIEPDELPALRESIEVMVEIQKAASARDRKPDEPEGGYWMDAPQPRIGFEPEMTDPRIARPMEFVLGEKTLEFSRRLLNAPEALPSFFSIFQALCNAENREFGPADWHRDLMPARFPPTDGLQEDVGANGPYHLQWNIALYDDPVLWVVPGSHARRNTPEEDAHAKAHPDKPLPGAVCADLKAGDGVVYAHMIIHWGSFYGTRRRRTIHTGYRPYGGDTYRAHHNYIATAINTLEDPKIQPHLAPWVQKKIDRIRQCWSAERDVVESALRATIDRDPIAFHEGLAKLHPGPIGRMVTGVKHLSGLATIVSPVLLMVFVPLR